MDTKFYVYVYLREDRYTPYYVGKGQGSRDTDKRYKGVKPPKDKTRIVRVKEGLTEEESFDLERTLIRFWGRKTEGGVLHNLTEGGEGTSGLVRTQENKDKIRSYRTGRKLSKEHIESIRKSKQNISEETRQKLREKKLGRKLTEEHKKNIGKGHLGQKRSMETRRKLSENKKEYYRKLREGS